jgi:hypothetical protein
MTVAGICLHLDGLSPAARVPGADPAHAEKEVASHPSGDGGAGSGYTEQEQAALNSKVLGTAKGLAEALGVELKISLRSRCRRCSRISISSIPATYAKEHREKMLPHLKALAKEHGLPEKSVYVTKRGPVVQGHHLPGRQGPGADRGHGHGGSPRPEGQVDRQHGGGRVAYLRTDVLALKPTEQGFPGPAINQKRSVPVTSPIKTRLADLDESLFIPRELSWLSFNARVLQEAADPSVPEIQRLRYLGIFSNNLDEFFRVRVAEVRRLISVSSRHAAAAGQGAARGDPGRGRGAAARL